MLVPVFIVFLSIIMVPRPAVSRTSIPFNPSAGFPEITLFSMQVVFQLAYASEFIHTPPDIVLPATMGDPPCTPNPNSILLSVTTGEFPSRDNPMLKLSFDNHTDEETLKVIEVRTVFCSVDPEEVCWFQPVLSKLKVIDG